MVRQAKPSPICPTGATQCTTYENIYRQPVCRSVLPQTTRLGCLVGSLSLMVSHSPMYPSVFNKGTQPNRWHTRWDCHCSQLRNATTFDGLHPLYPARARKAKHLQQKRRTKSPWKSHSLHPTPRPLTPGMHDSQRAQRSADTEKKLSTETDQEDGCPMPFHRRHPFLEQMNQHVLNTCPGIYVQGSEMRKRTYPIDGNGRFKSVPGDAGRTNDRKSIGC